MTLSNKLLYPNLFRTVPSDELLPSALATVMEFYGWRQVAIVTDREPQFLELLPLLSDNLSRAGISKHYYVVGISTEAMFVRKFRSIS